MRISPLTMFENWIPETSRWQPWGKPVMFTALRSANIDAIKRIAIPKGLSVRGLPPATGETAIIVDLPPDGCVAAAARLALEGYQPVPLFNAVPAPPRAKAAIDLWPIVNALAAYADDLGELKLPEHAPPVFMLASDRRGGRDPLPGDFDNRWVVLQQDLPSGRYMAEAGIHRVVVVQDSAQRPAEDLCHILAQWQQHAIGVEVYAWGRDTTTTPMAVSKPFGLGAWWHRTLVLMGLRRSAVGGFGSIIPLPSEGGSSGGWS